MDASTSSPDQEIEADQQPSELLTFTERDKSPETSDHVLPLFSTSQQEADTRHTLATEPFQPILKVLADLEHDDPKFAFPAAQLVGLYRRLWESFVSKHIDGEKLEQINQILKEASTQLSKERNGLQLLHDKQLSRLRFFDQALESSQDRLTSVLDKWNHPCSLNLPGFFHNASGG